MKYVLYIILKAHIYMIYIVVSSFVLEEITRHRLKLLIYNFKWKKSKEMARGTADFLSSLYFIFSLIFLLYDVYIKKNAPEDYNFWKWLVIMIPLTILFNLLYYKFQAKDPTKKGFHID